MTLILAPHCQFFKSSNSHVLISDEKSCYEIEISSDWGLDFFEKLAKGIRISNIAKQSHSVLKIEVITRLHSLGMLIEHPQSDWSDKIYQKQLGWLTYHGADPVLSQIKVKQSKVAIVGLGGVGSIVIQHLLASGVENFFLIDGDDIVLDNLNRQYLFQKKDVGSSKVDRVEEYLLAINPDCVVEKAKTYILNKESLSILDEFDPDCIVQCADEPAGRINDIVADFCFDKRIGFQTAALGIEKGYWGPLIVPDETVCYKCFKKQSNSGKTMIQNSDQSAFGNIQPYSFGPVNSIVSSFCAKDTILYLMGQRSQDSYSSRVFIDLDELKFNSETFDKCSCWAENQ